MDRANRSVHFRRLVGLGVTSAFLATVFVPAMAASQAQPTNSNVFSNKSIEKVVAKAKAPEAPSRASNDAPKTPKQATKTGSFFKTPTGVVVLVVMGAGTAYALRSVSKDRIHSPGR